MRHTESLVHVAQALVVRPLQITTSLDRLGEASLPQFGIHASAPPAAHHSSYADGTGVSLSTTQPMPTEDEEEERLRQEEEEILAQLEEAKNRPPPAFGADLRGLICC